MNKKKRKYFRTENYIPTRIQTRVAGSEATAGSEAIDGNHQATADH
jgi:hypothetical protein